MLRLAQTALEPADAEESVTVAEAARRLGCDEATVRALLRKGDLGGHRVGKCDTPRGIRVHASTIRDYKRRNAIGATPANDAGRPKKRRQSNSGHLEAERWLRANGGL